MIAVRAVAVADERARARLNALHQIERAVGKAIIRARGRGNRREQVACVAVSHGGRALADTGSAELPVVAVVRAGALRLAGGLHPLQQTRLQVIAVGCRLPERIRDARELVAVRAVGRACRHLLRSADAHLRVVAVGIVGEGRADALRAGRREHVVVAVISIRLTGSARQDHFCQIVVFILVGGGFLLQIRDAGDVAVAVIDIAVAELLPEQLDPVEIRRVLVVVIDQINLQQAIVLLRHDPLRGILPLLRIRVERNRLVIGRPVRIGKARGDTELARSIFQRHRAALRPTGHGIDVALAALDVEVLVSALFLSRVARDRIDVRVRLRHGTGGALAACAGSDTRMPAEHAAGLRIAPRKITVFNQVITAGIGALLALHRVEIGIALAAVFQHRIHDRGLRIVRMRVGDFQPLPIQVGDKIVADRHNTSPDIQRNPGVWLSHFPCLDIG